MMPTICNRTGLSPDAFVHGNQRNVWLNDASQFTGIRNIVRSPDSLVSSGELGSGPWVVGRSESDYSLQMAGNADEIQGGFSVS
jgi:hypothetical protein